MKGKRIIMAKTKYYKKRLFGPCLHALFNFELLYHKTADLASGFFLNFWYFFDLRDGARGKFRRNYSSYGTVSIDYRSGATIKL